MAGFSLCSQCMARFKGAKAGHVSLEKRPGQCHICAGALQAIPLMVASALQSSSDMEWGSFSVSSTFPRSTLIREAAVAEWLAPGSFTSLKNSVNAILISEISKASGKQNSQRGPDASFEFDFAKQSALAKPCNAYVFGHYIKLSRTHCQSRWHCSDCGGRGCESCKGSGQNYPSIEEELGKAFCGAFSASGATLHASGREDVDVRCLGTGRPFVMEMIAPRIRKPDLAAVEQTLSGNKNVQAKGLRHSKKAIIDSVCNSHFEKKYIATVSADRPLTENDAKKAESLSGTVLDQQTPKRVLARRADIIRKRKVVSIKASIAKDGRLTLEILAEAGTYIKELISSDGGRTKPSLSSILGCSAVCSELDVVEIQDYFIDTLSSDLG